MKNLPKITTIIAVTTIGILGLPTSSLATSLKGYFNWITEQNEGTAHFHLNNAIETPDGLEGTGGTINNVPGDDNGLIFPQAPIFDWEKTFIPDPGDPNILIKEVSIEYGNPAGPPGAWDIINLTFVKDVELHVETFISGSITRLDAEGNPQPPEFATITDATHKSVPEPISTLGVLVLGAMGLGSKVFCKEK